LRKVGRKEKKDEREKNRLYLALVFCFFMVLSGFAQGVKILTNQIGYEVSGSKHAVILGHEGDTFDAFKVLKLATGKEILRGIPKSVGPRS